MTAKHKRQPKARPSQPARQRAASRSDREEPVHGSSPTAVAIEAERTGVVPGGAAGAGRGARERQIPGEDRKIQVGDPDDDPIENEYSGEDTPGGDSPTPDQNDVDEIGRAYGLEDEDQGALRSGEEILSQRDRKRRTS